MSTRETPSLQIFTDCQVGPGNPYPTASRQVYMRLCGHVYVALLFLAAGQASSQTAPPAAAQARVIGAVTAVDATGKKLTLKTDAGQDAIVALQDSSTYVRIPLGEKDLKKATPISLSDVAVGDRVLARGRAGENGVQLTATSIIVMSKADIAKKQAADKAEWQRRGVAGVITEVNADAKEVTIRTRTAEGPKPLRIQTANATMRRYAADSVKFADAKPGTFADLKMGDQLRALGEKSADGATLTAEELLSGAFRNIAATVISVDADGKSVKITDLDTKKPVVVHVNADTNLRKMPPFMAQMIATRNAGGAPGGGGPGGAAPAGAAPGGPPAGERKAGEAGPGGGPGGRPGMGPGGGGMRGGNFDMQQMLERMPALTLAELKAGDALIIAGTAGTDPSQMTAIAVLSGVEPILSATPAGSRQMLMGSWNLDMNMNVGQ